MPGLTERSLHTVPAQNSAANVLWGDVIGNKTDTHDGDSLYARVDEVYDYLQNERKVYPTLAAGATVVSANVDWTLGAYATVIPINTIGNDFHIADLSIESCNRDAVFQVELYKGGADDIVTAIRFAVLGGFFGNQVYVVGSEEIESNLQVRARVASSNGTAQIATITLSVSYYEHQ